MAKARVDVSPWKNYLDDSDSPRPVTARHCRAGHTYTMSDIFERPKSILQQTGLR